MIWLFTLLFPLMAQAVSLPQPGDVVLVHESASDDKQASYNYIFTVTGETDIFTCQANRCSTLAFRDQPTIDMTVYQLPDGYQRVASVVDQTVLKEYQSVAVAQYQLNQLPTTLAATDTTRSYHTVTIADDGSFQLDTTSQERNPEIEVADGQSIATWVWWFIGAALVVASVAGWILWKRRS